MQLFRAGVKFSLERVINSKPPCSAHLRQRMRNALFVYVLEFLQKSTGQDSIPTLPSYIILSVVKSGYNSRRKNNF